MKRTVAIFLILAFVFLVSLVPALAAPTSSFADVPTNHWAYAAVSKLAKDGIVSGYDDGYFRGDKTLTRYEMAQIVANAITKEDKANAEEKALIEKLSVEFAGELDQLGVRVATVEKDVTTLKKNASSIKISGWDRVRFQQNDGLQGREGISKNAQRYTNDVRLFMSGNINDTTVWEGRMYNRLQTADVGNADNTRDGYFGWARLDITFLNVMPHSNLTVGRQNVQVGNGWFAGDYFDGGKLTFGNKLQGFVAYGDYTYMPGPLFADKSIVKDTNLTATVLGLQYPTSKATTLYSGYWTNGNQNAHYTDWDLGFNINFAPKFNLIGEYARNTDSYYDADAEKDKVAWMSTLKYGAANAKKPGSADVWLGYVEMGRHAVDWHTTLTILPETFNAVTGNIKGFRYGADYTISNNVVATVEYDKFKSFTTSSSTDNTDYKPYIAGYVQFWF